MERGDGADLASAMSARRLRGAGVRISYARLMAPVVRGLDAEIESRVESLTRDMDLRGQAHRAGDQESVKAFEFRMRESYGELLPRIIVRGLVSLLPHLAVLTLLYYLLPTLVLPGGVTVPTVSAYIAVGLGVLLLHHVRTWRRRHHGKHEETALSAQNV